MPIQRNFSGFTLIETIAVIGLLTTVLLAIGSVMILSQRLYTYGSDQGELIQNVRVCIDRLSRELRQAAFVVSDLSSSSTPATELFFQDGHDTSRITYIRYYLDGSTLMREYKAYYFASDPATYVYYDDSDLSGNPPQESVLEDRVVGEYFDFLAYWAEDGLVTVAAALGKGQVSLSLDTKVYIRNW